MVVVGEQCAHGDLLNYFTYFLWVFEIVHSKEEGEREEETETERSKNLTNFKSFVIKQMMS